MRRLITFAALISISQSCLCLANSVRVEAWQSGSEADTLYGANPAEFRVYVKNTINLKGYTVGLEISGSPGLQWTWGNPKVDSAQWSNIFDFTGFWMSGYDVDGVLPDLVLNGGLSFVSISPGERYFSLRGSAGSDPDNTLTICIDSSFVPPYGDFVFVDESSVGFTPQWLHGNQPVCWPVAEPMYVCGDANANGGIDLGDAVFLINYVFKGGPAPNPLWTGDANCDGLTNIGDPVYLINYIFKFGPEPCCP